MSGAGLPCRDPRHAGTMKTESNLSLWMAGMALIAAMAALGYAHAAYRMAQPAELAELLRRIDALEGELVSVDTVIQLHETQLNGAP